MDSKQPFWICPECGFQAADEEEMDKHIQDTGHVLHEGEPPSGNIGNPDKSPDPEKSEDE